MEAEQGPVLQVERQGSQPGQPALDRGGGRGRRVLDESHTLPGRRSLGSRMRRSRRFVYSRERAPQCLLPGDHPSQRPTERVEVQRASDRPGAGDVVGGAGRRELVGIPEHLLPWDRRRRLSPVNGRVGRLGESGRSGGEE